MAPGKKTSIKLMMVWIYFIIFGSFLISGGLSFIENNRMLTRHLSWRMKHFLGTFNAEARGKALRGDYTWEDYEDKYNEIELALDDFQEKYADRIHPLAILMCMANVLLGMFYVAIGIKIFKRSRQARVLLHWAFGGIAFEFFVKALFFASIQNFIRVTSGNMQILRRLFPVEAEFEGMKYSVSLLQSARFFPLLIMVALTYSLIFYVILPLVILSRPGVKGQLTS